MKTRKLVFVFLTAALLIVLCTACGQDADTDAYEHFTEISADAEGMISLPTEGITTEARFFNYDADGVTVQLVALRDKDDNVHIAFNTCQSCSPSPKAYYTQADNLLQCTNCGFTFAPEQVGASSHGGCSPWPIDGVKIGEEEITLPISSLEDMRFAFETWGGPIK